MIDSQRVFDQFETTRDQSLQRRSTELERPSGHITAWLLNRLRAERDHAERLLAAATFALAQVPLPR
jgi:hypothetical protein